MTKSMVEQLLTKTADVEKKLVNVSVVLEPEELARLDVVVKKLGIGRGKFLHAALLDALTEIEPKLPEEVKQDPPKEEKQNSKKK